MPRDSMGESGISLPLPLGDTNQLFEPVLVPDSDNRALRRLVSREVSQNELPSFIETIVSNTKAADIVKCLKGTDVQTFIDVIDEACYQAVPSLKNRFFDLFHLLILLVRH